uniref:Reverse transcriptase/retrotransposon-derived protein RNase H-like domain-containing protein n=1 Tax=Manihot esculenta TaxID=3983 RepID=A0A2C9W200_MANES
MRTHKLFAKASKCYFEEKAVEYLGHVINGEGVHTDPKKVQAVQAWPIPQNGYGQIAKPFNTLLKKGNFQREEAAQLAFETLKGAMVKAPVLSLPDFSKPFLIWITHHSFMELKGAQEIHWGYWTSRLVVHAVNTAGLVEDSSDEQQASYSADLILNKAAGCAASLIVQGWLGQQNCLRVGISARQQVSVGRPKSLARLD